MNQANPAALFGAILSGAASAQLAIARAVAASPIASQVQHRAGCGRRRVFLSANDARRYEAGWLQWPDAMPPELSMSTPYSNGWWDAEDDADARQEERMDMARARADE